MVDACCIPIQQPILCNIKHLSPLHSPDLAPNDYHLFTTLKKDFGGKTFDDKGEVRKYLALNFYDNGIKKMIPRYTKCIEKIGDYIEK